MLIVQTVVYFAVAVFVDKLRRRRVFCPRKVSKAYIASLKGSRVISADFINSKRDISYKFELERGSVTAILGETESGKSQLVHLLSGIRRTDFRGSCLVQRRDLLHGEPLMYN